MATASSSLLEYARNAKGFEVAIPAEDEDEEIINKQSVTTEKGGVDFVEEDGSFPLWWAVYNDDKATALFLLDKKECDVNRTDHHLGNDETGGRTCLSLAAMMQNESMVELLLSKGADVHLPDIFGMTPLHYASDCGNPKCVRLLLEAFADPNSLEEPTTMLYQSSFLHSPLGRAALRSHTDVCHLLLAALADPSMAFGHSNDVDHEKKSLMDLVTLGFGRFKGVKRLLQSDYGSDKSLHCEKPYRTQEDGYNWVRRQKERQEQLVKQKMKNRALAATAASGAGSASEDNTLERTILAPIEELQRPVLLPLHK